MKANTKAYLFEEGGKILSGAIRLAISRPHRQHTETTEEAPISPPPEPPPAPAYMRPSQQPISTRTPTEELDYRYECVMKHLGAASVLLREAYERAIDEGIGDGTAEKIMEALNEHAGSEEDIEKMLAMPDAKAQAEKLLSGVRAFRRAAWEAKLPTGGGTKDDVADARLWNDILYQEAFANAKSHPGEECIRQGM